MLSVGRLLRRAAGNRAFTLGNSVLTVGYAVTPIWTIPLVYGGMGLVALPVALALLTFADWALRRRRPRTWQIATIASSAPMALGVLYFGYFVWT